MTHQSLLICLLNCLVKYVILYFILSFLLTCKFYLVFALPGSWPVIYFSILVLTPLQSDTGCLLQTGTESVWACPAVALPTSAPPAELPETHRKYITFSHLLILLSQCNISHHDIYCVLFITQDNYSFGINIINLFILMVMTNAGIQCQFHTFLLTHQDRMLLQLFFFLRNFKIS